FELDSLKRLLAKAFEVKTDRVFLGSTACSSRQLAESDVFQCHVKPRSIWAAAEMKRVAACAPRRGCYFSASGCFASSAIFSNRGSPRSGSQNGISFSWP